MSESKSESKSRRQFLKYGAAVVVAAAAGAAGYGLYQSSQGPSAPMTVVPTTYTTTAASSVISKPIDIWWVTEFFPEEQLAFLEIANSYTALTGTPVHVTFYDFKAAEAKLLTAVKTGEVPDISNDIGIAIGNRLGAQGGLADVSDVIADLKKTGDFVPVAEEMASVYNAVAKSRSYYQVPQALQPFVNVYWHDVFKKYTGMDVPPTDWDGWWGAFKQAQDKGAMKDLGMYAFAYSIFSPGGDSEDAFSTLMYAHGANPLTADGKVNYSDPAFKKAVGDVVHFIVDLYQKGYIPAGSTAGDDSWNNVVIESKKGIMCYANGSLSIPAWFRVHDPDNYKNNIYWAPFPATGPSGNTYKESVIGGTVSFIMKDGKNIEGAKDFIRYFMKPENYNNWFVGYQYRYLPVLKSSLDTLPMYTDPNDHIVPKSKSYLDTATVDYRYVNNTWSNASYGEHVLSNIATSVLTKNMSEADALNAAFARLEELSKQAGE